MKINGVFAQLAGILSLVAVNVVAQNQTDSYETHYERWHVFLSANPILTEPMWFSGGRSVEMDGVLKAMQSNKMEMAIFLCDKLASQPFDGVAYPRIRSPADKHQYRDFHLLRWIAGIDLIAADDKPVIEQDLGANMARFMATFREEWRAGVYKDPVGKIREILALPTHQTTRDKVDFLKLMGIRRYGLFGLPELIRQIRQHNSKPAFAAYLIISGHRELYAQYINQAEAMFPTVETKLTHVRATFDTMKSRGPEKAEIERRIEAALAE